MNLDELVDELNHELRFRPVTTVVTIVVVTTVISIFSALLWSVMPGPGPTFDALGRAPGVPSPFQPPAIAETPPAAPGTQASIEASAGAAQVRTVFIEDGAASVPPNALALPPADAPAATAEQTPVRTPVVRSTDTTITAQDHAASPPPNASKPTALRLSLATTKSHPTAKAAKETHPPKGRGSHKEHKP